MKTIGEEDGSRSRPERNVTNLMMIMPEDECNSSNSSSIGDDSDADGESRTYVYDRQNDNSFDDAIQALEQALPIRRGISTFYNGKSKSFTCLAEAWPTQDIAKPENAYYTRKRKNLGAFRLSNMNTGRICKKPKTSKFNFMIQKQDPDFTTRAARRQINRPLALRSFSMVNFH